MVADDAAVTVTTAALDSLAAVYGYGETLFPLLTVPGVLKGAAVVEGVNVASVAPAIFVLAPPGEVL